MNAGGIMVKAACWYAQDPWFESCIYTFFLLRAKPVDSMLWAVCIMYELVWVGISRYRHGTNMFCTCFLIAYTRKDICISLYT